MTPLQIITKAREFIGTPWHHCGRVKGVGVDCSGLVVCTFRELGENIDTPDSYTMQDEFSLLIEQLERFCIKVNKEDGITDGDIFVIRNNRMYNHVGFFTSKGTLLHAYQGIGKVVEHTFNSKWDKRIVAIYRYRGVYN